MRYLLCAAILMLCSCRNEDLPQAPTAEQSDQLNEIDDMLNQTANDPAPILVDNAN